MEQPGHDDRHELAAAASPAIGQNNHDGRNRGKDEGVAPALPGGIAEQRSGDEIDRIGEDGSEDQEPEIHLGIPEDPAKEKNRPGDVPQDHRSVSDPIQGRVGERIGNGILFPRDMLEPVRHFR